MSENVAEKYNKYFNTGCSPRLWKNKDDTETRKRKWENYSKKGYRVMNK